MSTVNQSPSDYVYTLPEELIAHTPVSPRDAAKLMIYRRAAGTVEHTTFQHLPDYLPKHSVLVFNRSKVVPARITLKKATDEQLPSLYLDTLANGHIRILAREQLPTGTIIRWEEGATFVVMNHAEKWAELSPQFPIGQLSGLLDRYGTMPLPPYIQDSPLSEEERRTEYQTVYADRDGSAAAPTAGLHVTEELLKNIEAAGHTIAFVTLHVGLGTFAPLTPEELTKGKLHEEYFEIDKATAALLQQAKKEGRPVIAVGTTSARTLESAQLLSDQPELRGITDLFLHPDNPPQFIDGLITNFHVPKSSLMMLVAALTGREKLLELYQTAIDHRYRFFSFGDGMMIL